MALLDDLPDTEENRQRRIFLLVNQQIVFALLLRHQDCYDLMTRYEALVARIDNPGLKGGYYTQLGGCHFTFGNFDKAIETGTKATQLCEAAGNAEEAGHAYQFLEAYYFFKGDLEKAIALKKDVVRKMDECFNLRSYVWALCWSSGAFHILGRYEEAEEDAQKALSIAQDYSDNSLITQAAMNISILYGGKGDLTRAFKYAELATQSAPTPLDKALAQNALAGAWLRAGEPKKAIVVLEPFVQVVRAGRYAIGELLGVQSLAMAYILAGEYDQARQTSEDLLAFADRCGAKYYLGLAHLHLGIIAVETNPAQATPHFDQAISILREIKAESVLALAYAGYGVLNKRQGRITEARQYLTQALEIFERLGHLIDPDKVREELADLT